LDTLVKYPEKQERWLTFHEEKMNNYADEWPEYLAAAIEKRG
jgi:hypothetical protein